MNNEFKLGQHFLAGNCSSQLVSTHKLKNSEQNFEQISFEKECQMLRNFAGLHAPLKLVMERKAFKNVGRLPFLHTMNPHLDCLSGRDEMIDFDDVLGGPEFCEDLAQPHAVVAKKLNI